MDLNFNNPEQIKQLISLLQQMLPSDDKKTKDNEENDSSFESPIRTKSTRSNNNKNRKNKFLDMQEKNMHKEDIAIDKRLAITSPTPRNREFVPVEVRCRSCGKKEKVSPAIVPDSVDRYKCNNCSTTPGD